MPRVYEAKCKRRLDKQNPRHKRRHTTLCAALARNGCLTATGHLKKSIVCHKMSAAVNLSMTRRGM